MQVRVNVFTPPPQVLLHSDSDHSVYPPLIASKEKISRRRICFSLVHASVCFFSKGKAKHILSGLKELF